MVGNIFGPDLGIVIVVILVVLIGGSQLPKIARNVGTAGREFKKAQQEADEEAEREQAAKTPPPAQAIGAAPVPAPVAPSTAPPREESVTLSRSELDALLKAREEQARREATGSAGGGGSGS
jgi:sec-independent protein translocase protein TatA